MNSMLKSVAFLVTLCLSSLANADVDKESLLPKQALSHVVGDFKLSLLNDHTYCSVRVTTTSAEKTIPLLLNSPCYWITDSQSDLIQHAYTDIDIDATLLVAGTRLDWPDEKMAYQKLPDDSYCSEFLQGLVIHRGDVSAVDEKMLGAHCESGLAMDEKIFHAMAHNPQRYQEKDIAAEANSAAVGHAVKPKTQATADPKASAVAEDPPEEEKSFIESVTDSIKSLFSSDKDAE